MKLGWKLGLALILLVAVGCASKAVTEEAPAERPALDPERPRVMHSVGSADKQEVFNSLTVGLGDQVWTERRGRALLRWRDLWVRLYDDGELHVEECGVATDICLGLTLGTVLNGGVHRTDQRIKFTTGNAAIEIVGTTVMISHPAGAGLTVVRVFEGQVQVRNLTGTQARTEPVRAGQWALVRSGRTPQVSSNLEEMRALARELGLWDVYHAVELDVQGGFGPSPIPAEQVAIVFEEEGEPQASLTLKPTAQPSGEETPPTPPPPPRCEVVAARLNLRTGPGVEYDPPITKLVKGTPLEPLARNADGAWILVRVEGLVGWVSTDVGYSACNFDIGSLPVEEAPPLPTAEPTIPSTEVLLPDLVAKVGGPGQAATGEAVGDRLVVEVYNGGRAQAGQFSVGLYLSTDPRITSEDWLLKGGREFVESLRDGQSVRVPLHGDNAIPLDLRPGQYFIGALVDELNRVRESDESNNDASYPIMIEAGRLPVELLYDFVAEAPHASWYSLGSGGTLPWPGKETDERGFARWVDTSLEDGTQAGRVLEMHPSWEEKGYIWGEFPTQEITLQPGDHFVARVGLMAGAEVGNVVFRVEFLPLGTGDEFPITLGEVADAYDGQLRVLDIDLSDYAGQQGLFYLWVLANGPASQDWAVWAEARLDRRGRALALPRLRLVWLTP